MGQTTSFDKITSRLLRKIEKDKDFFEYYNLSVSEVQSIVMEQAVGYLYDAIDLLTSKCEPDTDFYDYDEELQEFNFDSTKREIGLLADLMRQVYYERQEALLGAFKIRMTPSDLNHITPSTERSTFLKLVQDIRNENDLSISSYVSSDRETNKRKTIDHSQYDYS